MKTIVSGPQPICCSHCPAYTDQTVDRARGAGWRIGWRPDHPTWCPECFGLSVMRAKRTGETFDEPMF